MNNQDRAELIEKVLTEYFDLAQFDHFRQDVRKLALSDLLTDVRHYCDDQQISYAECDNRAYEHYVCEAHEERVFK